MEIPQSATKAVTGGMFIKTEDFYLITTRTTSGFKIERLKDMQLQDDGTVKTISIEQSHTKWFREGSVAILAKEDFIGESYIEILPGKGQPFKPKELNEAATTIKSATKKYIPALIEQTKKYAEC